MLTVSKTYDIVSPESATKGDFCESGFIYEKRQYTLPETLSEINELGSFQNLQDNDCRQSLYSIDSDIDPSNGHETCEALHITGPKSEMRKLYNILKKNNP